LKIDAAGAGILAKTFVSADEDASSSLQIYHLTAAV